MNITELGLISFIGDHTFWTAVAVIVLFILYKIFVEPIIIAQKKMDGRG